MRDEHARADEESMVRNDQSEGRLPVSEAHHSNGFTAVNGDVHVNGAFRPDDSAAPYMPRHGDDKHLSRRSTPINPSYHSHGWRPADRADRADRGTPSQPPQPEYSPGRKRKRSISLNVDNADANRSLRKDQDEHESSKRLATSTLDSAIDLTSPVVNLHPGSTQAEQRQHDHAPVGSYARERSPVARWNRGEPPPKPSSEIEASLAESVNKFHQTQQTRETQRPSPPELPHPQSSPPAEVELHEGSPSDEDDDEPQPGENADPKKARKRNFSNRTKTGCHTCRSRKKKCDEKKPTCGNCERGNFTCQGYGPKPPNGVKPVPLRHMHVQPKGYDPSAPPAAYYHQSPSEESGLSYSHWGRVPVADPPLADHRIYPDGPPGDPRYPQPSREGWPRHAWPHGAASYFQERFPPPDYPPGPPYSRDRPTPSALPPPQQQAPPPISDPFAQYGPGELWHRASSSSHRPPTVASSTHSGSQSSQHAAHLALSLAAAFPQPSEKDKMLRGQPFLHWLDACLIAERDACALAVACYNRGARSDNGLGREAKAALFAQILDPGKRIQGGGVRAPQQASSASPVGSVREQTIVEAPFRCEYGYNVHLGASSVVQAGCYLQDAADITIGDRVILGPGVNVYTLTAAGVESGARKGSQGPVVAGAVAIEDDVFVGANAVILPYCTIGRGAVVGAGSVVTRDVKENTVVAGNPAKFIRAVSAGGSSGEALVDWRHAAEIQERNERVKKRMVEYANSGFSRHSPRLI